MACDLECRRWCYCQAFWVVYVFLDMRVWICLAYFFMIKSVCSCCLVERSLIVRCFLRTLFMMILDALWIKDNSV